MEGINRGSGHYRDPEVAELSAASFEAPVDIGKRVEPFVDDWLIEEMDGVKLELHHPAPREIALRFDAPWEGATSYYPSVVKDDRYRLYYRASGYTTRQVMCYAESDDGINWNRPSLGIEEFEGSTENNIFWAGERTDRSSDSSHNLSVFKDSNPDAAREEQYKGLGGGVYALSSGDSINWRKVRDEPVMSPYEKCEAPNDYISGGFWDTVEGQYVAYLRGWRSSRSTVRQCDEPGPPYGNRGKLRQVLRSTSPDFVNWSEPRFVDFGDSPLEHFYTFGATPYFRAPHVFLAFPMRFLPKRKKMEDHKWSGVSDTVLLSSRDGVHWDRRFMEGFIPPGRDPNNWTQRSNMTGCGIVPTGPDEISLYYIEHYRHPTCRLRRATLRTDGFVSVRADYGGGTFVTRPLTFGERELVINYSTSAASSIKVEIRDTDGQPIPGRTFEDSEEIYGDEIDHAVRWTEGRDPGGLVGHTVRLAFAMKDADLYSIRFRS